MSPQAADHGLIGTAPAFQEMLEHVSRAAPLNRPVLVIGERGTGKELVAARLHYLSKRWDKAFIRLNCAALNESLLETELFGYEAGAYTGASKRQPGRFELAHGGSLFLDELATCSIRVQEKLLRVIEYGEFERVGGRETIRVDVRVIGATNADLPALAAQGHFREDLLDRLAFDVITLPPLRARQDDILQLAESFALRMAQELKRELFAGFSSKAQQQLLNYQWPGNVRELKNVVERALYRNEPNDMIPCIDTDPFASAWRGCKRVSNKPAVLIEEPAAPTSTGAELSDQPCNFESVVAELEQSLLKRAMECNRFNQRKAAEFLGLTYHQLRGYLRKYKLLAADNDAG
jgi:psp operon transcriptional activator